MHEKSFIISGPALVPEKSLTGIEQGRKWEEKRMDKPSNDKQKEADNEAS